MKKANLGEPLEVGRNVVVIGGGYTAMDCSRTSLRHGAENVTIAYRRTRSELVVDEEELGETEREGVRMEFLVSPIELIGEDGQLTGVKFIRNKLGEPDASGRRSPVPIAGLGVRRPGRHRHPGRLPGGRPELPAGRVELRGRPRPAQGGPGDLRHERSRRLRLRRLRDRPHDAHRVGRPRQEGRLRDRPLPGRRGPTSRSQPTSRSPARGATRCRSTTTSCRASTSRCWRSTRGCRRATRRSTSRPRSSSGTRPPRRSPSRRAA